MAILICIVIIIVCILALTKNGSNEGDETEKEQLDVSIEKGEYKGTNKRKYQRKVVQPFLDTINKPDFDISKKKDGKIQLSEYFGFLCEKVGSPLEPLNISQKVKQDLIDHQYNAASIKRLANLILDHMHVPYAFIRVELGINKDEEKAGSHSRQYGRMQLYVSLHYYYSVDQVIAIVCHECTHEYMYVNNIQLSSERENERLTDATAIYMGLGNLLLDGYIPTYEKRNLNLTVKHSIGYLKPNEIIDLIRLLPYAKKESKKKQQAVELAKEKIIELERQKQKKLNDINSKSPERLKSLREKLQLLDEILGRYKEVYHLFINAKVPMPKNKDADVVTRCINDNDFKQIEYEIQKISDVIAKNDKYSENGYKKLAQDIDRLCTELTLRSALLGKYL